MFKLLDAPKTALALILAATTLVVALPAFADDDDGEAQSSSERKKKSKRRSAEDSQDSEEKSEETVEVKSEAKAPEERRAPEENTGETDHDQMVGHIAIGFYGLSDVPVGLGTADVEFVSAPAIGARLSISWRLAFARQRTQALGTESPEETEPGCSRSSRSMAKRSNRR